MLSCGNISIQPGTEGHQWQQVSDEWPSFFPSLHLLQDTLHSDQKAIPMEKAPHQRRLQCTQYSCMTAATSCSHVEIISKTVTGVPWSSWVNASYCNKRASGRSYVAVFIKWAPGALWHCVLCYNATLKPEALTLRIGSTDLTNSCSPFPTFINAVMEFFAFLMRRGMGKQLGSPNHWRRQT